LNENDLSKFMKVAGLKRTALRRNILSFDFRK